jgi:hypothetical protein
MNFFDPSGKASKPFEMIQSKNKSSVLHQIWFSRAVRILSQLEHIDVLLKFFEFCVDTANRFSEYLKSPS